MVEAVTWSFISQAAGRAVRRRQARAGARQSDRGRAVRHAAEPHPGPGRGGAEERRPRLPRRRRCSRSGRFSGATSRRISSPPRAACGARWPRRGGIGRHWSGKAADGRCLRRQGRRARGAGGGRRAGAGAAGRAGRAGLVSSRPLRHHPDRAAERARPFRRAASARAGGARRRGPAGRLRGDPGEDSRRQGQGDARQAGAGAVGVPAGDARLRLRGRPRGEGRRHRARRAERRPQADRRRHACSTSTKARASSPARSRSRSRSRSSRAKRP